MKMCTGTNHPPYKCNFGVKELNLLGHRVSLQGIQPLPDIFVLLHLRRNLVSFLDLSISTIVLFYFRDTLQSTHYKGAKAVLD